MGKKMNISRKTQKIILVILVAAVLILGIGLFVYIHTVDTRTLGREISIYGLDVSRLTVEEAGQKITDAFENRSVIFREDGEQVYETDLKELGYTLDQEVLKNQLTALKEERDQNRKLLPSHKDYRIEYQVQKNEEQEKNALTSGHFGDKERTKSEDASIRYSKKKKKFVLVKQVQGNEINEASLQSYVNNSLEAELNTNLLGGEIEINLGTEVYEQPEVKASKDMKRQVKSLNSQLAAYRSSTVTYTFGAETVVLDSATVDSWIIIDGTEISIDQEAAGAYISDLANKYNTIYIPRTFYTSSGTEVTIQDNEYGYRIDYDGEMSQLLADLQSGEAVTREPVYSNSGMQRNGVDDLAGSYIEVSLDAQHLWLYKDGALVTETDIVSGSPSKEETYRGAWPIAYKASPFTLSSEENGYEVDVKYWMPFVYGQGLHDASWQSAFGGDLYRTGSGSHGCINLPEDQAAIIYNTIDGGYPIIIY
ncbi:MAG: L,D-transpeptidase family protein [Eubacteriales bacterium]|nr:L,D-transpeptidase family protein [Eubacteriales bacterium]